MLITRRLHSFYNGYSMIHNVLITGASSGIGRSCAFRFAASGAGLILTGRRIERLKSIEDEIMKLRAEANDSRSAYGQSMDYSRMTRRSSKPHEILLK